MFRSVLTTFRSLHCPSSWRYSQSIRGTIVRSEALLLSFRSGNPMYQWESKQQIGYTQKRDWEKKETKNIFFLYYWNLFLLAERTCTQSWLGLYRQVWSWYFSSQISWRLHWDVRGQPRWSLEQRQVGTVERIWGRIKKRFLCLHDIIPFNSLRPIIISAQKIISFHTCIHTSSMKS